MDECDTTDDNSIAYLLNKQKKKKLTFLKEPHYICVKDIGRVFRLLTLRGGYHGMCVNCRIVLTMRAGRGKGDHYFATLTEKKKKIKKITGNNNKIVLG